MINLTLKIWRQKNAATPGKFETYPVKNISIEMSFLEMIDVLNEELISDGKDPIAFDHDCREGICGACSMYINGRPHGPWHANTTCQLHMRAYKDGDTIVIEPWRANAFPVIKDLVVDRTAFDRIIQAALLFVSAKVSHLALLPQGGPERKSRAMSMVAQMDKEGFGSCTNTGACEAVCPKEISIENIARLNREYMMAGAVSDK